MATSITKYKILVASPSDVKEERDAMDEVIAELNITFGNRFNLIIELIKWETHTAPAIGNTKSTQDIVDSDLGDDYDLFIGVLWKKFGTKTEKFSSGTEQEYRKAYERFKTSSENLQILFYFKMASPTSLSEINPNELSKVNSFKNDIGEKGVYYWEYNTIEELQRFLRIHIPRRLEDLNIKNIVKPEITNLQIVKEKRLEDELGILDYTELIEEAFNFSTQAVLRIVHETNWIGIEINKKANELETIKNRDKNIDVESLRDFFNRTAGVMDNYATRIAPEIPIFYSNFERGADAISKLSVLYHRNLSGLSELDIEEINLSLDNLIEGTESGLNGMEAFLNTIILFPRVEKKMNRARLNVETSLHEIVGSLKISLDIAIELKKNLK